MSDTPIAIVTGSSRGIGRGVALCLAERGYDITVNYAGNRIAAEETRGEIEKLGRRAEVIQADVRKDADRRRLVDETVDRFGRLDLLVNNAGIAPRVRADLLEMSEESYREVLDANLAGPFFLTQYVANRMIELRNNGSQKVGRIIFVTSVSAYAASINRGEYCVSKAGLSMTVQLFASRLATEKIWVYEIQPGIIATDMTSGVKEKYDHLIGEGLIPQGRWGTPDDVGKAAAAIAGGDLDFSTGAIIEVGGGFGIRRL